MGSERCWGWEQRESAGKKTSDRQWEWELPRDIGNGEVWAIAVDVAKVGWRTRSLEGSCSRNWEARVLEYFQIKRRLECRTLGF